MKLYDWLAQNRGASNFLATWKVMQEAGDTDYGVRWIASYMREQFGSPFKKDVFSNYLGWDEYPAGTPSQKWREVLKRNDPEAAAKAAERKLSEITWNRDRREIRRLEGQRNFVITCAVNNCFADPQALKAFEAAASHYEAELLVIPVRYQNPTRKENQLDENGDDKYWWDPAVVKYLFEDRLRIHEHLVIMGDVKVQATSNPLKPSRDPRSRGSSAIIGHPKLQMRTVPTPQNRLPKLMYSTGAITQPIYSNTDVGDDAFFHHSISAILVEIRGSRFHVRELAWDDESKSIIDLDNEFTPRGRKKAKPPLALYMGDTHQWFMDPLVHDATWGEEGIVATLSPERVYEGDGIDFFSINRHVWHESITRAVRAMQDRDSIEKEIEDFQGYVVDTQHDFPKTKRFFTYSNHDAFLMAWLQGSERNVEPKNAEFYHDMKAKAIRYGRLHEGRLPTPLQLIFDDDLEAMGVTFLGVDESSQVAGIECGMHGHLGPNGSRGSIQALSRIGTRSIIGHSHGPGIFQGVYQVGTSSFYQLDYNRGPSSWLQTHALINANGKRQLIHIIDGHWRG